MHLCFTSSTDSLLWLKKEEKQNVTGENNNHLDVMTTETSNKDGSARTQKGPGSEVTCLAVLPSQIVYLYVRQISVF